MKLRQILVFVLLLLAALPSRAAEAVAGRWSEERANAWYAATPWPVGANYVPRSAINQLEMWQAETFDLETIDQEFGWAAAIGMNAMRVFLHDLLWQQDRAGFMARIDRFLGVADQHHIKIMFVFFDGVWDPHPYLGMQRTPRPHVHNSGWVQSPGRTILGDPAQQDALKPYVQGILQRFKDDPRILAWDLFNEPDNPNTDAYGGIELGNKAEAAQMLLEKTFAWAREVNPSQPLTAGIWLDYEGWKKMPPIFRVMLAQSDIITFHNYGAPSDLDAEIAELRQHYNRPLICTEYMARGTGNTFDPILGELKKVRIGAIHWGLVEGKSQTNYPWETWKKNYHAEPAVWHHDVFRADGRPYRQAEVDYIKAQTRP